ncbi:TonB-dependent receptor [Aurantiacibacter arachoides]|nr:TonB-dependent receptor [Aurantiacibacter arachoides]
MILLDKPVASLALALALCAAGAPLRAQDMPSGDAPPPQGADVPPAPGVGPETAAAEREVYTPADFARYAPRTAFDMIARIPGFSINGGGGGGRGLGQASGNLLINGERVASKSNSTADQLSRIPAGNVVRIEVVDGATLDIPGLSGRIANIVVETSGVSGQYEWRPGLSLARGRLTPFDGEASVTGALAGVGYTLALRNGAFARGQGGPAILTDALGVVDARENVLLDRFDRPTASGTFAFTPAPGVSANVNLSGGIERYRSRESERRVAGNPLPFLDERIAAVSDEWFYEIGGDVTFPLGGGQLKLIALEAFDHKDRTDTSLVEVGALPDARGSRFRRVADIGERIGRGEYTFGLWGADWQVAGEAAFNRLDQKGDLFVYDAPRGDYLAVPFPQGRGGVREDRYEGSVSSGFTLAPSISIQAIAGAEYATLSQTGSDALSRTFVRPKGSLRAAWAAMAGLDLSLEIARRVGQLDFGDFLASVSLESDRENLGNNRLRPQQSWETRLEAVRDLGALGTGTLTLFDQRIEDLVLIVPVASGGAAQGNIPKARRYGAALRGTLQMEPLGWQGARIDGRVAWENSRVEDPVTGLPRRFDGLDPFSIELNLRHDVPDTDWAWGGSFRDRSRAPYFRVTETFFSYGETTELSLFAEHKDVLGATVRLGVSNLADEPNVLLRTVSAGRRGDAPLLFTEERRRSSGPRVQLRVAGSF